MTFALISLSNLLQPVAIFLIDKLCRSINFLNQPYENPISLKPWEFNKHLPFRISQRVVTANFLACQSKSIWSIKGCVRGLPLFFLEFRDIIPQDFQRFNVPQGILVTVLFILRPKLFTSLTESSFIFFLYTLFLRTELVFSNSILISAPLSDANLSITRGSMFFFNFLVWFSDNLSSVWWIKWCFLFCCSYLLFLWVYFASKRIKYFSGNFYMIG